MQIWNLNNASPATRAGFLIGFGVLVTAATAAVLVWAVVTAHVALWIVGGLFAIVAVVMVTYGVTMMRDAIRIKRGGNLLPVVPRPATGAPKPWTWLQLAGDVAARFEGTSYVVEASDERIRVTANLANAAFATPAALRNVHFAYTVEILPSGDGKVRLNGRAQEVEASVGADGMQRLVATGRARSSGTVLMRRTRRVEYGFDADGFGKKVDIDFSSAAIHAPINAAIQDAGLRKRMSPERKGALFVAAIALLAVPLVPLMLWLQSIGVVPPSP